MTGRDANPDAICVIHEINRLNCGGEPHPIGSAEAQAVDRALHRCAQVPDLAGLAAIARKAISAARTSAKPAPTTT